MCYYYKEMEKKDLCLKSTVEVNINVCPFYDIQLAPNISTIIFHND